MNHLQTIVDYLRYEREPIERWRLAAELARMSRVNELFVAKEGGFTKTGTQAEYDAAIGEAIASGKVVEVNGRVRIVAALKASHSQRELF